MLAASAAVAKAHGPGATPFAAATRLPSAHIRRIVTVATGGIQLQAAGSSGVEVFSTIGCPYCVRAKKKLAELGVPFIERDVTNDEALRAAVAARASRTSVPQIFIGGEHVGGCDDLFEAAANGRLAQMLEAHGVFAVPVVAVTTDNSLTGPVRTITELLPRDGILNHPLAAGDVARLGGAASDGPRSSAELATTLQSQILGLYDSFVVADGSRVDYVQMVRSGRLHEYCERARLLAALSPTQLPAGSDERLAFWLNLYNALVIHGNAVVGAPTDRESRGAFYSGAAGVAYNVAGWRLSLDDVEHGIIRGSLAGDARSFAPGDARSALVLPRRDFDPRVHFALNCGARSCPPIKIYDATNLERGLALAAQSFCESTVRVVDGVDAHVEISKIFEWYRVDFGATDEEVLERIVTYLGASDTAEALRRALRERRSADATGCAKAPVRYAEYDWGSNDAAVEV